MPHARWAFPISAIPAQRSATSDETCGVVLLVCDWYFHAGASPSRATGSPRKFSRLRERTLSSKFERNWRQAGSTGATRYGGASCWRQRVDADQRGAGVDDDRARAGIVLRRAGSTQEYSRDHDAKLRDDGADQCALGAGGIQPGVRRWREIHRRFFACVPAWRRHGPECGLCRNDSPPDVHDLPDDVRGDYAGADHWRHRGADEVQRNGAIHDVVVFYCVRSAGAHGVGQRRIPERGGGKISVPGFRGRDRGAYFVGRFRAGVRFVYGQANRISETADAAPQSGAEFHWRVFIVGRMVWI